MWFLFYVVACFLIGISGRNTNIGFWGFFFISFLLSPIFGFFIVTISSPRDPNPNRAQISRGE